MDQDTHKELGKYELITVNSSMSFGRLVLEKQRSVLGRATNCDLRVNEPSVSAIHLVIDISENEIKIYDLNSKHGTYLNDKKIIVSTLNPDDVIKIGNVDLKFVKIHNQKKIPPVLGVLSKDIPPIISENPSSNKPAVPDFIIKKEKEKVSEPILPISERKIEPEKIDGSSIARPISIKGPEDEIPSIVYPLKADPQAEFSEYIFEDLEELYPIFKYDVNQRGVEVVIVFKDRIYSADFLPYQSATYKLKGLVNSKKDSSIEYPYLGKKEVFPFVTVENGSISVQRPSGYETVYITDEKVKPDTGSSGHYFLRHEDILVFTKDEHKLFVRLTDAPPKITPPPFFRREKELKKYLFFMVAFVSVFLTMLFLYPSDEELEKEKVPEKIRTILYRPNFVKKVNTTKPNPVAKTKKAPKVAQKSPVKKAKTPEKKVAPKKVVKKASNKKAGQRNAKKVGKVRKSKSKAPTSKTSSNKVQRNSRAKTIGGKRGSNNPSRKRFSKTGANKGNVDAYKSDNFKSSISNLLAKGGSTSGSKAVTANSSNAGYTDLSTGGIEKGDLRRANVAKNLGSLTGSTVGRLDATKGAEGIVNKKTVYTAGIPSNTVVLGSLDPNIIRKILRDHLPLFRSCYQRELENSNKEFGGALTLIFKIGASGSVTKVGLESATKLPGPVSACVKNVLRGIPFPEPQGGGTVDVRQPMNFYPKVR